MNKDFVLMAQDCISFALRGLTPRDYQDFCKRTLGPGTSYYDRMRVAERLIEAGSLYVSDGKYRLGTLRDEPWLVEALTEGSDRAWTIVDSFPVRQVKFDPENLINRITGLEGEEFVVDLLNKQLPRGITSRIEHVSLKDDSAGYDIASPSTSDPERTVLLEVKTTTRPGQYLRYFLSRNEADVGLRHQNWFLVFVVVRHGAHELAGFASMSAIRHELPVDPPGNTHWMSARMESSISDLRPNLP